MNCTVLSTMHDAQIPNRLVNITDVTHNCRLTKADIVTNQNLFITMQVLKHKDSITNALNTVISDANDANDATNGEVSFLYIRRGRIGNSGMVKLYAYMDSSKCIKAYERLFLNYTGTEWGNIGDSKGNGKGEVKVKHGKYIMLDNYDEEEEGKDKDVMECKMSDDAKFFMESTDLQTLTTLIFDTKQLDSIDDMIDTSKTPLGKLSTRQLDRAHDVLQELGALDDDEEGTSEERVRLSSIFYTLIPTRTQRLKAINNSEIQSLYDLITSLRGAKLITKAKTGMTLFDKYTMLNCKITLAEPNMDRSIREYFTNTIGTTHANYKLHSVLKIDKGQKFDHSVGNVHLLWHGSRSINFSGILKNGLLIKPPGVTHTGSMFGNGVYFANCSTKSTNYTSASYGDNYGILLLCQVALGNVFTSRGAMRANEVPDGHDSVLGPGQWTLDHDKAEKIMINGVNTVLNTSTLINDSNHSAHGLLYDEYIVYRPEQIRMAYICVVGN